MQESHLEGVKIQTHTPELLILGASRGKVLEFAFLINTREIVTQNHGSGHTVTVMNEGRLNSRGHSELSKGPSSLNWGLSPHLLFCPQRLECLPLSAPSPT